MAEPGQVEIQWVAPGAPAVEALRDRVTAAQAHDPLAPVTVVSPTPAAAVAARRRLGAGALAGVTFTSMDGLVERLAARALMIDGRRPMPREALVAAVRAELASDPGQFAEVVAHRRTQERLARLAQELEETSPAEPAPEASGTLAADARRVAEGARRRLGSFSGPAETMAAALKALTSGEPPATGPVVVHVPGRLTASERHLLSSLAEHVPVAVLLSLSGSATADEAVLSIARQLAPGAAAPPPPAPAVPTLVLAAPDADEEVRSVLRRLVHAADQGVPLHRMALLYGAADPYARIVVEQARAAGIPVRGPAVDTLATSAAGRTLLGALHVIDARLSRDSVIDLVAGSPVVGPDRELASAARWDDVSRRAGVVEGERQWDEHLAWERERRARLAAGSADAAEAERHRRIGLAAEQLRQFVTALAARLAQARRLRTWADVGPWAVDLLDSLLGPSAWRYGWPAHELDAAERVEQALHDLGALSEVEPSPGFAAIRAAIEAVLEQPAPRQERVAGGLLVGPVGAAAGLDLDAVAVVGVVEGALPRVGQEDALFPDAHRARLGLPTSADDLADQHRAFLTALASASTHRVLSFARGDQRSGRTQAPSRWLLDRCEALAGARPKVADLMAPRPPEGWPWFEVAQSFHDALLRGPTALDRPESDLAALTAHRLRGLDVDGHPAAADPLLAAVVEARRLRRSPSFNRFQGDVSGRSIALSGRTVSPTGLEDYAACPRRYFFGNVLEVDELERPEGIERVEARTVGSLAHDILEALVSEALDAGTVPAPGAPWSDHHLERLRAIAHDLFTKAERKGIVGHRVRWAHDRARIQAEVERTLEVDRELRAERGTSPAAVELAFGLDAGGEPPLEIDLGGRVLRLRGRIDRLDEGPDVVRVIDYKTGRATPASSMVKDPFGRGRRLQLGVYAMVAQRRRPGAAVRVDYWYVSAKGGWRRVGYDFGPAEREELLRIVGTIVEGIEAGVFPAHPGGYDPWFRSFDQCRFCTFDRVCPGDRHLEWQQVHLDPRLRAYVELAEGPLEDGAAVDG